MWNKHPHSIILLCLPPHTSHILQLLDANFLGPLKTDFSVLTGDLLTMSHSFLVSKKEFSIVEKDSYQILKDQRMVAGFFLGHAWCDESKSLAPPPPNPYITHPLVVKSRIAADLAHLQAEINYGAKPARSGGTPPRPRYWQLTRSVMSLRRQRIMLQSWRPQALAKQHDSNMTAAAGWGHQLGS